MKMDKKTYEEPLCTAVEVLLQETVAVISVENPYTGEEEQW